MIVYRDYGAIEGRDFPLNSFSVELRNQVWKATHLGDIRLPMRYRSFISFSFGGKWIEDYDLIAYCKSNTMSRAGSADFEDLVSDYDIMDGLYYHGTHFKPNTLELDLVTDGIDLQRLDDFLHWFRGGMTRELILAEHPNRAIMARVSQPPQLEMLPFEKKITLMMAGSEHTTSTTLYKGTISLSFTADVPFWYAKQNLLIYNQVNEGLLATEPLTITSDLFKEALKIMYEDNVPLNNMIQNTMHFGIDLYANVDNNIIYTRIAGPLNSMDAVARPDNWDELIILPGYFTETVDGLVQYWCGAKIDGTKNGQTYLGRIAGAVMAPETTELTGPIPADSSLYLFYYGGNAPSPTILSFKVNLTPVNSIYIDCFANDYVPVDGKKYSTITIESTHKKNFDFTISNIMASWNKAKKLFTGIVVNETNLYDFIETLRDLIHHPAVRAWAIAIVSYMAKINLGDTYFWSFGIKGENGHSINSFTFDGQSYGTSLLDMFWSSTPDPNSPIWSSAEFTFNAELGTAIGKFSYWKGTNSDVNVVEAVMTSSEYAQFVTLEENVGDMLRSNWLILEDLNKLQDNLYVVSWSLSTPLYAHKVYHNAPKSLIDLRIQYKNRYL